MMTIQSQVGTVILSLGACRFYGEPTGIDMDLDVVQAHYSIAVRDAAPAQVDGEADRDGERQSCGTARDHSLKVLSM